jgi:hypothetical protein
VVAAAAHRAVKSTRTMMTMRPIGSSSISMSKYTWLFVAKLAIVDYNLF